MDTHPITTYLTDHLAGSAAAIELFERLFEADPDLALRLRSVYEDVRADRELLVSLMERLDVKPGLLKQTAGWLGERLLSLKQTVEGASDAGFRLTSLEVLSLGILGKYKLWQALATGLGERPYADIDFARLQDLALAQHALVEEERLTAAAEALQLAAPPA